LGERVLFEHRELIRGMVLSEDFAFPSNRSRLYEMNRRQSRGATNREIIEASGLSLKPFCSCVPVVYFKSDDTEECWSASLGVSNHECELFPARVVEITRGEFVVKREGRRMRGKARSV
jgi:hypothetical protein